MKRANRRRGGGSVRIIGGHWRGTRIDVVDSASLRPTPDRVRETLFNWLDARIGGARCLDLYAGTGVLGFEALSRGALEVRFVERDAALAAAIQRRARSLGAKAEIVCADAKRYAARAHGAAFDIVFVDPPYELPLPPVLAELGTLLAPGAAVYAERAADEGLPAVPGLTWFKRSRAGAVCFGLARVDTSAD